MKRLTNSDYQKDNLYPGVVACVSEILAGSDVVTPVEVLLRMQRITKQQYEDWRFGRIPYLERVCAGSLSKLNRILRIIGQRAGSLGLAQSQTVYRQWGRSGKPIKLRFSKSGDQKLEAAYSRHYLAKDRMSPRHARKADGSDPPAVAEGTNG